MKNKPSEAAKSTASWAFTIIERMRIVDFDTDPAGSTIERDEAKERIAELADSDFAPAIEALRRMLKDDQMTFCDVEDWATEALEQLGVCLEEKS